MVVVSKALENQGVFYRSRVEQRKDDIDSERLHVYAISGDDVSKK
jgi:hypothetical protein